MSMSPRGTCPECGKTIHIRKDGMLRLHGKPSSYYERNAPYCDGSGRLPASSGGKGSA